MTRRVYWGLAIFIILLICVGCVLVLQHTDTNREEELLKIVEQIWNMPSDQRPTHYFRFIEEYPYSKAALRARYALSRYKRVDGNFQSVGSDTSHKLSCYKEMLKYHPDSPRLLYDLAHLTEDDSPEEAIAYGKKALKYIDKYPADSTYGLHTYPEEIHYKLGQAYQEVGDYKSALVHLKAAQSLMKAYPDRPTWGYPNLKYVVSDIGYIESIPPLGPYLDRVDLSDRFDEIYAEFPGFPLTTGPEETEVAQKIIASWDIPSETAEEAAQREREEQDFAMFLAWLARIESVESPQDLDNFLMREVLKHLRGESSAFSPDRLMRAYELFQEHGDAEGINHLQKIDPDLAKAVSTDTDHRVEK